MSRAGCRELHGWAALTCAALLCAACSTRPAAAPTAPEDTLESPPPASEKPLDDAEQSELDALDLDLVQANKHLEEQLSRKRTSYYRADSDGETERDGIKEPVVPETGKKRRPDRSQGGGGTATKPPDTSPPEPKDKEAEDRPVGLRGSPCDLACRALHSMERSAERICALAGESSERCQKAKRMVQQAAQRVRDAGCGCTEGKQELMSRRALSLEARGAVCSR
ncbi:MAG: hypothetical protein H6716_03190 [Polyangiaceae bacterium]|nr:hypothetical protein [Polyangiaceae bacterium]